MGVPMGGGREYKIGRKETNVKSWRKE